jgi:sporulation protein YlmC with PRC-barrel domain
VLLKLGTPVRCGENVAGSVADVVVEPSARRLTHIVVETQSNQTRLVPVELVADGGDEKATDVVLTCSVDELHALESTRRFAFLHFDEFPSDDADSDVGVEDVRSVPYADAGEFGDYTGEIDSLVSLTYDRIPKGEAELRRASDVVSADGHRLGHVEGFVVQHGTVTHIVLERGHLWGTRDITIPIESVDAIETDTVTVRLSKDEIGSLPAVKVHRHGFF